VLLFSGFILTAQTIKINTPRPFSTTGSKAHKGSIGLRDHNEQSANINSKLPDSFFLFFVLTICWDGKRKK